jgi:hypothetical protein
LASDIRTALSSIPKPHPRSVLRDHHSKSSVLAVEHTSVVSELLPTHQSPIPSAAEDIPPTSDLELVLSAESDAAGPLDRTGKSSTGACREPHEICNPIADPTVTTIGADEEVIEIYVVPSETQLSQHEIASVVSFVECLEYVARSSFSAPFTGFRTEVHRKRYMSPLLPPSKHW